MRSLFSNTVWLLACLCSFIASHAQNYDIFTQYGPDDGLPQSSIWSIVQDRKGFMWVGTSDGLCRFDGYNFTVYKNDPADVHSVIEGVYYRMYIDSAGNMWVISQKGVSLYNDKTDNFTTIYLHRENFPNDIFNSIFGEDVNYIWAAVPTHGLLKIDKRSHKQVPFTELDYEKKFLARPWHFTSWQNGFVDKNKIWICTGNTGFYIYDIYKKQLLEPQLPNISSIANFNDSEVIASRSNGLIVINKSDFSYKTIDLRQKTREIRSKDILVSGDELILATQFGLVTVDTRTWQVTKEIHSFTPGKKQTYANVQCLYKDRSGNIWVGINGDGLKKIAAPWKKFHHYSSYSDSSNLVKGIYADAKYLYTAYFGNGVDIFDRQGGFIKNITFSSENILLRHIYAITKADSNTLLLNMSDTNVVYTHDLRKGAGALRPLLPAIKKLLPGYISTTNYHPFFFKTASCIYAGLNDYLLSFNVATPNIQVSVVHHFKGEPLTCAYTDGKGTIWVGSINSILYLDSTGAHKVLLSEIVHVKSINEDTRGNIWAATINGIYVIGRNKRVLHHYTEGDGLTNRFVYGLLRDNDGNMWFSHNKGISVYKTTTQRFRHYTKEDGLQSNEFNTGAYFKAADGTLFFGGVNGTNAFDPHEILDNPNVPTVNITNIEVFDKKLKSDVAPWNVTSIELPYDQNSLSFEFAAMEYTNPKQNRYAYKMEKLDKEWINAGDRRFTRYPGLPPGHYIFKVKACNNDGIWQTIPTEISIVIVPPFWQRLWFRILVAVLLVGIIAAIILLLQRQRYKRKMRAVELQQKIQMERERISRDLHDNVGTQLSLISNNIEWVLHPLKSISEEEKASKLLFVNQTARDVIATLRETIWALNKEQISLEEFSDKLKAFVQKQLAIYPAIQLQFTEQITAATVLGPSEALNLFRICQEAIANALKYAGATQLTLDVKSNGNGYTITITDNGRGFSLAEVDVSLQNGIENMRYRAADIAGTLDIDTKPGKGTTIVIAKNSTNAV